MGLVENSPQGKNGVSLGFILCCWCNFGFWLFVFLQREGFLKLDEVLELVLRPKSLSVHAAVGWHLRGVISTVVSRRGGVVLVMLNRENENIGYREPNIGYSIV